MIGIGLLLLSCSESEMHTIEDDVDAEAETGEPAVENESPSQPTVRISPPDPTPDEDLLCALTGGAIDPEGDALTTAFAWEIDGVPTDEDGEVVSAALTADGEQWTCIVTVSDGISDSPAGEDSVAVFQPNRAPSPPVVSIFPEAPGANHTLECLITEPATDPDGDTVSYTYAWSVDGTVISETTDTLSSEQTAEGEQWTCTVTPGDGELIGADGSDSVSVSVAIYGEDITSGLVYDASNCSYCPDNDWYIPDKAFDDSLGTGTESWDAFWTDGSPEWISVDFGIGNERTITRYGLMGSAFHEGYRAKDWQLQGSDDETLWDVLHTVTNADLTYVMYGGEPFTYYTLYNETAYRFYRVYVTANMGGQQYNNAVNIVEIEMMEDG